MENFRTDKAMELQKKLQEAIRLLTVMYNEMPTDGQLFRHIANVAAARRYVLDELDSSANHYD